MAMNTFQSMMILKTIQHGKSFTL